MCSWNSRLALKMRRAAPAPGTAWPVGWPTAPSDRIRDRFGWDAYPIAATRGLREPGPRGNGQFRWGLSKSACPQMLLPGAPSATEAYTLGGEPLSRLGDRSLAEIAESGRDRGPVLGQQAGALMRSQAQVALGTEAGSDGLAIGRDPRKMGPDELRELGHMPMAPAAAIRAHCLDCCGGSSDEVRKCTAVRCPSWPFRLGANPWRARSVRPSGHAVGNA